MTIEPIPDRLLEFFHETNFVTRIEIESRSTHEAVVDIQGRRSVFERDRHHTFEMLAIFHYDEHGQTTAQAATLSAFMTDWVAKHRTVAATSGGQPWNLMAREGRRGTPLPRQGSFLVTGFAFTGDYMASDLARMTLASMVPVKPVIIRHRNILAQKQRGLEL